MASRERRGPEMHTLDEWDKLFSEGKMATVYTANQYLAIKKKENMTKGIRSIIDRIGSNAVGGTVGNKSNEKFDIGGFLSKIGKNAVETTAVADREDNSQVNEKKSKKIRTPRNRKNNNEDDNDPMSLVDELNNTKIG